MDAEGLCVRSPRCHVEAEFFSGSTAPQPRERPFFFGQPSLAVLSPQTVAAAPDGLCPARGNDLGKGRAGFALDFFVHNCEIAPRSQGGWNIALHADDQLIAVLERWEPVWITRPGPFVLRVTLVNPAGEELLYPEYNVWKIPIPEK